MMPTCGPACTPVPPDPVALAPYAAWPQQSRGRDHDEPPPELRDAFQRDRDRVVHCSAFRRLEYKTQVFVNHQGDLYRTRLTHSLEVAQIARTMARSLDLNEDLSECIALAHDLGHTPFGHAGQDALNRCMRAYGGFEHNLQSLRVVDKLETRYAAFAGLNLSFESREGILKHCARAKAVHLGAIGQRFLTGSQPSLEAQMVNLADEIAYNHHDLDDGLRSGLLSAAQLASLPLFARIEREADLPLDLPPTVWANEVIRRMISATVCDLVRISQQRIVQSGVQHIDEVRHYGSPLIALGEKVGAWQRDIKTFLRANLYRHPRVHRMSRKAERVVTDLFTTFMDDPALLPLAHRIPPGTAETVQARMIADYIAGMTDRFAIQEHGQLFNPSL